MWCTNLKTQFSFSRHWSSIERSLPEPASNLVQRAGGNKEQAESSVSIPSSDGTPWGRQHPSTLHPNPLLPQCSLLWHTWVLQPLQGMEMQNRNPKAPIHSFRVGSSRSKTSSTNAVEACSLQITPNFTLAHQATSTKAPENSQGITHG